jgi:hypothetical protein
VDGFISGVGAGGRVGVAWAAMPVAALSRVRHRRSGREVPGAGGALTVRVLCRLWLPCLL